MTSKKTVTLEFQVDASDSEQGLRKFAKEIRQIASVSKVSDAGIRGLSDAAQQLASANKSSEASANALTAALRKLQQNATIGSQTYKDLGAAINIVNQNVTALKSNFGTGGFSLGSLGAELSQIKAEIGQLDLSTQAGRTAFAQKSAEADRLARRLDVLAGSYKKVSAAAIGNAEAIRTTFYPGGMDPLSARMRGVRGITVDPNQYGAPIGPELPARRGGGRQNEFRLGQTAGVLAGASIYGGPAGFLGGAIGAAGGPGGALIGAQIGAQVGMLQMAAAGAATYAAEIRKLEVALRNVTGSEQAYGQGIEAVDRVVKSFNITRLEATRGFTQLSAAVIGAGGDVKDAEIVFQNVTAAIKATGGNAQDAEGAMRALTQIFSKGKVSAEELRGQLGERLPGATTLFAQSIGVTGEQLDKMLENGEVGLNDLMKFVGDLGTRYNETAMKIAASQEDAGARMQVSLADLREELGKLFLPLGAEYQRYVTEITASSLQGIKDTKAALGPLVTTWLDLRKAIDDATGGLGSFITKAYALLPLAAISPAGFVAANMPGGGPGAQQKLVNAGSQTVYSDAQGNVYDTATGRMILAGGGNRPDRPEWERTGKDDKKDKADAEAKRQQALAERLAADQRRLDETTAMNAIKLAEVVYERERDLARRLHDYKRGLAEQAAATAVAGLPAGQREGASMFLELVKSLNRNSETIQELDQRLRDNAESIKRARDRERVTAVYGQVADGVGFGPAGPRGANILPGTKGGPNWNEGPGYGRGRLHAGQDLGTDPNDPVAARLAGIVEQAYASGFGKAGGAVVIKYVDGSRGTYGHTIPRVRAGQQVVAGQIIAAVANDGQNSHLHYELRDAAGRLDMNPGPEIRAGMAAGSGLRRSQPGVVAGINRNIKDQGQVQELEAERAALQKERQQILALGPQSRAQAVDAAVTGSMQNLRDRIDSLGRENELLQIRNGLELELASPEFIDQQVKLKEIAYQRADAIAGIGKGYDRSIKLAQSDAERLELEKARTTAIDGMSAAYDDLIAKEAALFEQRQAQERAKRDPSYIVRNEMKSLQDRSLELSNYGNQAVRVANTIGDSFGNAFSSVISGTSSVNEALNQLFTDIARSFAEMAAEILANQLKILLLNSLTSIFGIGPAGGGGLGGGFAGAAASALANANGNAFTANGVVPFARGGVVDRPTMFQYGAGNLGIMGEAGAEAILPLKRRSDGRLGVMMERPAPMRSSGRPYEDKPIRLETITRNGEEWATIEQVREAMQQARRQGAEQGRASAYSGLQRSVGVRRKLGLNG